MAGIFLLLTAVVAVCASAVPSEEMLNLNSTCDQKYTVTKDGDIRLYGTGESPAQSCSFAFEAEATLDASCPASLCYMFDHYAHFTDPKVNLVIESGSTKKTYKGDAFDKRPVCTDSATLKATMNQAADYMFNKRKPKESYKFTLTVFHKCGEKGSVQNSKFEDVIDHAKGYHTAEEREEHERNTFVTGIVLGFGLACIFLVVLFVGYCYTRNSPNRPPGRSVGMPKVGGFKKKMKPNQSSGPKEVEMGVRYQTTSDTAAKQPESEALLKSRSGDPEKPPLDSAAITVSVDDVDEIEEEKKKKPETEPEVEEKSEQPTENKDTIEKSVEGDNSGGITSSGGDNYTSSNTGGDNFTSSGGDNFGSSGGDHSSGGGGGGGGSGGGDYGGSED